MQQEVQGYELIVVNDGSDDGTKEYLDSLLPNARIKIIHQSHAGRAATRNAGIKLATGSFIAFTDDDCTVPKNWLNQFYLAFQSSQIDIIGGRVQNAFLQNIYSAVSQETTNYFVQVINQENAGSGFLTSNNIAYRKATLQTAGGFDVRFRCAGGEERALNLKIISKGGRSLFAPDIVVRHHQTLTFRTFIRQQFKYGRGSYLLYQVIAKEISSPPQFAPIAMYLQLLVWFLKDKFFTGIAKAALFCLGQLAVAMGFLHKQLNIR